MELHCLHVIENIIYRITDQWAEVYNYMEGEFGDGNESTMVQNGKYDRLVFDDATYSRSRQYFWAICALEVSETTIAGTMKQWRKFHGQFAYPFSLWCEKFPNQVIGPGMSCSPFEPQVVIERIEISIARLLHYGNNIKTLRQKLQSHSSAVWANTHLA